MKIIHTVSGLQKELASRRKAGEALGFVPTMGALHRGHVALIERSVAENAVSVASIFVNPAQFNDKNDLLKYPRTLEADCKLLEKTGNDIVFAPEAEEIYPEPDIRQFEFGAMANVMEGEFRPRHFNGVAQVVSRLFDIVKPGRAYFGEKDFQQLAIIRLLVQQLHLNVRIVACPIVREDNGLAMSSRNTRLSREQRQEASAIFRTLFESRQIREHYPVAGLKLWVTERLNRIPGFRVEYFDIVDGTSLQSIRNWEETECPVGCIAVFVGEVRLIDNVSYAG
ncbi:MAG: pantoate--beta-alanine ligase [Candidatus Symbiothrix sp.]|jgi:pantoate--beta-alanine ligase|nr:pantoate--beta-alanine ligase [Candidatus Symbiothrix sp.]